MWLVVTYKYFNPELGEPFSIFEHNLDDISSTNIMLRFHEPLLTIYSTPSRNYTISILQKVKIQPKKVVFER